MKNFMKNLGSKTKDKGAKINNKEASINELPEELVASECLLQSNNIVKNYVIISMGLGMVPVPLFDIVALIGTQIKLVHRLAKHYEVPFKRDLVKSLLISLTSGVLGVSGVIGMASLAKVFPIFGSLVGSATASSLSGSLTYAVGQVFIWHFEQGGTLLNFDPKKMRKLFKRELEEGKAISEDFETSEVITSPKRITTFANR